MTTDDEWLSEREQDELRDAVAEVITSWETGEQAHWAITAHEAVVKRIVTDRVAKAKRRGAVEALREAAGAMPWTGDAPGWLDARADHLDQGGAA